MTIKAKVIAHSIDNRLQELVTFKLLYPRAILAELNTHRMLSRCSSSSRAIPIKKQIEYIINDCAMPVRFGYNQAGMKDTGESCENPINIVSDDGEIIEGLSPTEAWDYASLNAIAVAEGFANAGYHKQVANRLLEPFQHMNTIVTATDLNNFFHLRYHKDADPTFEALAHAMWDAYKSSVPQLLNHGEYHLPFVKSKRDYAGALWYYDENGNTISLDEAKSISASCVAQISYRNHDASIEKARKLEVALMGGELIHGSPFEHQATPFSDEEYQLLLKVHDYSSRVGIEVPHLFYHGNFRLWHQYRKEFSNENVTKEFIPS